MYARSERKFIEANRATGESLGPGCYTGEGANQSTLIKPAISTTATPFSTIAPRVSYFDEIAQNHCPAPNVFDVEAPHEYCKAVPFGASKQPRFQDAPARSPGPNVYKNEAPSAHSEQIFIASQLRSLKENRNQVTWKRQFLPPSIPYGPYREGYDEEESGVLVPRQSQVAPDPKGALRAHGDFIRKSAGTNFAKSMTKRHVWKGSSTPGPGVYNVAASWHAQKNQKPEHFAADRETPCVRFGDYVTNDANRKAVPGPGSYDVNVKTYAERKGGHVMSRSANRGMAPTADPFSHQAAGISASCPGPAAYDVIAASQPRKPLHIYPRPFNSSSTRFNVPAHLALLPGPAKYNITEEVVRKPMPPSGKPWASPMASPAVFGSVATRFVESDHSVKMPGPASYNLRESVSKKKNVGPMHVFHVSKHDEEELVPFGSNQDRFLQRLDTGPMPGAYEVGKAYQKLHAKSKHHRIMQRGQAEAHEREAVLEPQPGPQDYNPGTPSKLGSVAGAVFKSKQPRLKSPVHNNPAPNAFIGHDTIVRKTFNATLEGEHHILGASVGTALHSRLSTQCNRTVAV